MLVKWRDSDEVYLVMAISIDHEENITYVYLSFTNSLNTQYRNNIAELEIVDSTLSDYWTIGIDDGNDTEYLSFSEWTTDLGTPGKPGFYERYLEGEPEEIEIMRAYYDIELRKAQEWVKNHPEAELVVEYTE